ncbi:MAG: hypothetical protein FJX23_05370 [Alphaproteobacteria bacterium]|nr:hypothetical protein [Alphaproteobacteria bacterium]
MHEPQVRLESGGSIVINPTEALVSIDVNSGRSTTERNVEETALKTNLEAAAEVARQVRLRDLAGLIVIDFIDMFDYKNRRAVERQLKESLKNDRAKIQVGRISAFGLLEMSRQRMRPSIGETNTIPCPHCDSRGFILSPEATGMQLIRFLEKEAANGGYAQLTLKVPAPVAIHLLNNKRTRLLELEKEHGIKINIDIAEHIRNAAGFVLERVTAEGQRSEVNALDGVPANSGGNSKRKRDRKRNNRRDRDDFDGKPHSHGDEAEDAIESDEVETAEGGETEKTEQQPRAPRPPREEGDENGERGRRRRGGRRRNRGRDRDRPEGERNTEREADGNRIPEPEFNDVNGNVIPKEAPFPSDDQPSEAQEKEGRAKPRSRGGRGRRSKAESGEPSASPAQDNAPEGDSDEGGEGKGNRRGWWRRIVE